MKKERRQPFKQTPLNKDNEVTTKIYKINKILDTSKYKILGCLFTATQKSPDNYVPGCHRIIDRGDTFQNINISVKEDEDNSSDEENIIVCNIGKSKTVKIKENSKGNSSLWHVTLNSSLSEPLVSIYVRNQPIIVLVDTGSEVNCISYRFCLLYTSPSPRDRTRSRMPSSA